MVNESAVSRVRELQPEYLMKSGVREEGGREGAAETQLYD